MQRCNWFIGVVLLVATTAFASIGKVPIRNVPVRGGANDPVQTVQVSPDFRGDYHSSLDSVGVRYLAGYTYYEYQHNGTTGRMIYTDANGIVHVVWMRGLTPEPTGSRHVYYNYWDPSVGEFANQVGGVPAGQPVNSSTRAGYVCMAGLADGWVFPTFHEIISSDPNAHTASSMDYFPGLGAFTTTQPTWCYEGGASLELIWPKVDIDVDSVIHVVSCENPASGVPGDPQRVYYSRGHPTWDPNEGSGIQIEWDDVNGAGNCQYLEFDTVMVIAPLIVTSKNPGSHRVAIVWSKSRDDLQNSPSQYNNDLYYMVSEDGGNNWNPEVNITQFAYPDLDCASGDTLVCDRDTFRVYEDLTGIFDLNDNFHACFTTCYLYELEGLINIVFSDIWHWDEEYQEFSNVVHGYFDGNNSNWIDPGAWQRVVQRGSLSLDPETGYLYCTYQMYDSLQTSDQGWPMSDIYVAFSRNCGRSWSEGINVTTTDGGENTPPPGSLSEKDNTANEFVTYVDGVGYLDIFYLLDHDAGNIVQTEGTATLNEMFFRRIPVDELTWQLHNPYYPALHVDSTDFPGSNFPLDPEAINPCPLSVTEHFSALRPESFRLYQNYPNPFNPTTNIQFDLARNASVSLKVFNVTGQLVATLYDGQKLSAGARTVTFDASHLASGVYIYRIEADGISASKKMVLMK